MLLKKGDEINIKVTAKIDKANLIHIQGSNGKVSMIKLEDNKHENFANYSINYKCYRYCVRDLLFITRL